MLTIAAILDEFSEKCFSPECRLVPLRSDDYVSRLTKSGHIDLLLVESAWRGPQNTWSHHLVNTARRPVPTGIKYLTRILKECKSRGIPTVFWAKEDPVHFKHFISVASLFNFVATTDANCVPVYRKQLNHRRVFTLPFAAQIDLHNPISTEVRSLPVCFAGTCRDNQYPNRKAATDVVLQPAIPFGLHIFDRAKTGSSGESFPDVYKNCILGGLPYNEILQKYHQYKIFLNVNSVDNSPTMFSRRVFELLACGTPVISSYSLGIQQMLPEVLISRSPTETVTYIQKLLNDSEYWKQVSVAGIRRVLSAHTYAHRLKTIFDFIHVPVPTETLARIEKAQGMIL